MLTKQEIKQVEFDQERIESIRKLVYKVAFRAGEKRLAYKALSGQCLDNQEVDYFFSLAENVAPVPAEKKKPIKAALNSPFIKCHFNRKKGVFL